MFWQNRQNKQILIFNSIRTEGVNGTINFHRKSSAYILQEDHHHTLLTVHEMMMMACKLKIKNNSNKEDNEERVDEILSSLNLIHRKTSTAETLSGGERKRLSIALELVTNPSIIFLVISAIITIEL